MSASRAITTLAALVVVSLPPSAGAQERSPGPSRFGFLVSNGTLLPTGAQKSALRRAGVTAAQLSYAVRPAIAVTTTLGWARSRDITSADTPKLDVFAVDLGAEARVTRWMTGQPISFRPFAGIGAGMRAYNYRHLTVDATHNLAAYGSIGAEVGVPRIQLRLEARNYVSGFKPLQGLGATTSRNDVIVLAGLRITRR